MTGTIKFMSKAPSLTLLAGVLVSIIFTVVSPKPKKPAFLSFASIFVVYVVYTFVIFSWNTV
ncbi:hypothetical protein ACWF7H_27200 [Peribacillus butanolivorans]